MKSDVTRLGTITVALGEYDTGWHDPVQSLERAAKLAGRAATAGADLLVLPEMCASGFTMEAEKFAEPADGPSSRRLSAMAKEHQLWIVAGLSTRRNGKFLNSALAFAPDGCLAATYDKQRLFGYAEETSVYSPGTGPCVVDVAGVSLGLFVCFDLRFPEIFRAVAPEVDALVVIANWPSTRQRHWEVLSQARAIENQCYMIAVNRTGEGDGLKYEGGSAVFDPWGERSDKPGAAGDVRLAQVSHAKVDEVRAKFPLAPPRKVPV